MDKPRFVGIRLDIETRSGRDLKQTGVYPYAEDPDFAVLTIGFCPIREYPGGARKLGSLRSLDLTDTAAVAKFQRLLADDRFEKHAFNAAFERVALSRWIGLPTGTYIDPSNWRCSSVHAMVNGIFGTLDEVARATRSPIKKDPEGRRLINLFSKPIKPNAKITCDCEGFHDPANHSADFAKFESYCRNDVLTEAVATNGLPPIPDDTQAQYEADQRINDRGIRHFRGLSRRAVEQVAAERDRVMDELRLLTGVDNPNSTQQMHTWLEEQDYPMPALNKESREEALADPEIPETVAEALRLKGAASLSSVAKHKAALATRCADGRIRGSLQFHGAHTGREAGRGIQPQNLPRYEAPKADRIRLLLGQAGSDAPLIAKGTVRSSLVPAKKHLFVVLDYNAIEARVLGWLAGEKWVEDEFRGEGKIYEATASTMFGIDKAVLVKKLKQCGKCGKETCEPCRIRSKGKVSNLALGYAGGAGALVTMGAEAAGIDIGNYNDLHRMWEAAGKPGKFHEWQQDLHDYPELIRLRDLYRDNSPKTVSFWKQCGMAWDNAAVRGAPSFFGQNNVVKMMRDGKHNRMVLPSGRSIWYRFARSHFDPDRPDRIDRRTFIGKAAGVGHVRTETHGGKLTENVTQAVARDVLFDLIMKVEDMTASGWPGRIVLHVHDEVVLEVPSAEADQVKADVEGLMSTPPDWAPGLAVRGEGSVMERYGK